MSELLSRLSGDELIPLFALAGSLLVAVVAILAGNWRKVREAEIAAQLKKEMLEQGRSAEEIATVVSARPKSGRNC